MMLEFHHPLPVVTPLGEGYALYVRDGGAFENDVWCVVLDDSRILHFRTNELNYVGNATLGMQRPAEPPESKLAAATRAMAERR
jgi:hypothetical protein